MAFARTIVEAAEVSKAIDEAVAENSRIADLYDGLKWRLARDPEAGYLVPGTDPELYVLRSESWQGIDRVIVVAYTFNANEVEVKRLRVVTPEVVELGEEEA